MDSLLANYASSDDEDQPPKPSSLFSSLPKPKPKPSSFFNSLPPPKQTQSNLPPHHDNEEQDQDSRSSLFSSLPKPKPSSLFPSLPTPKQTQLEEDDQDSKPPSSVFSSLPAPKSQIPNKPITNPKRVVQFTPPINPYFANSSQLDEDDDDDDEEEERRRRKASEASSAQPLSVTSFLSAIPAPRNSATLGVSSGLGSGSGRRAIVETESVDSKVESDVGVDQNIASIANPQSNFDQNAVNYEAYGGYETYQCGIDQNADSGAQLQAGISGSDASSFGNYNGFGGYSGYAGNHGNEWVDGATTAVMGMPGETGIKVSGKRRRNDVPTEILEVKQDELIKNRPREDQAKLTGVAFGPSYQPVSTKGKPTKLHKRKHQIGSLYFDMKQKEMELQERRSKGFLTKAETQAKYGW